MNASARSACSRQVLAVIAVVTGVRALLSCELELTSVESYSWLWAQHLALGYYDHPGMTAWLGRLSMALFGSGVLAFRALTLAASAGTIWLTYLAARRLYDDAVARRAALLMAVVPLFFIYSAAVTPDAPCLFFWSTTVWALTHALSNDSPGWWAAAGLFLGLAMDSKYHAAFLGLGLVGFLLGSPEHRFWLKRREPWIGAALAALAFLPTIVWNAQHGWQSFAYQGLGRFGEGGFHPAQLWRFASSQLLLITPVLAVGAWGAGLEALVRWRRVDWKQRFLTALGSPVLLFFALVIFMRPVRGHWAAPGYLTVLILWSARVDRAGPWTRRLHDGSVALLCAGVLLLPAVLALAPKNERTGWAVLGEEVRRKNPGFILSNDYHVASQMGFALRTKDSWDLTPIGKPSKSFPNWWDEKAHLGMNAVIVCDSRHFYDEMPRIKECFEGIGLPVPVTVPRLRIGSFGEAERYWVLSASNYKGARLLFPRDSDSEE